MMKQIDLAVGEDDLNRRLDRVLRKILPTENLGSLFKALRKGIIRINSKKVKPDYRICQGDIIQIKGSLAELIEKHRVESAKILETAPKKQLSLNIIWNNADYLVLNKTKGRLIHGPEGIDREIQDSFQYEGRESLSFKPGPLHRLDRNTSGVLFFSNSLVGAQRFTEAMKSGTFTKIYLAVMEGELKEAEVCEEPLSRSNGITRRDTVNGTPAKSVFYPLHTQSGFTIAAVRLYTGRTHQIRCHAAIMGHPLAGDVKYGGKKITQGYRLHAWQFKHKDTPPLFPDQKAPIVSAFFNNLPFSFTASELNEKLQLFYGDLS